MNANELDWWYPEEMVGGRSGFIQQAGPGWTRLAAGSQPAASITPGSAVVQSCLTISQLPIIASVVVVY